MAMKSDFAQKLLHDLRVRKEMMASTENSSRNSGQTSRDMHGNAGRTSRSDEQFKALESIGSRKGNPSRNSTRNNKSINFSESSNQIVLYERGQNTRKIRDLSTAIAFAFENNGKFSKYGTSSGNPLIDFFNRFGGKSNHKQKIDITGFENNSLSTGHVSHVHISEISKGVENLNQILRDGKFGKELLRGSIDLEESLRMLVNFQETSAYINHTKQKSRIKLLEEDEDDQEDADNWQLSLPRFSQDNTSRDSCVVQNAKKNNIKGRQLALSYSDETSKQNVSKSKTGSHKRSAPELNLSTEVKETNGSSSSQTTPDKRRLSNVIAKLMGLEELPQMEDSKLKNGKEMREARQRKVSSKNHELPEPSNKDGRVGSNLRKEKKLPQTHNTQLIRSIKLHIKGEMSQQNPDESSKMVNSEENKILKDSKVLAVGLDAASETRMMHKQQLPSKVDELQIFPVNERKLILKEDTELKLIKARERKALFLNTEQPHMAQSRKTLKVEDVAVAHKTAGNLSSNALEKRNANKDIESNQQKLGNQHALIQVQVHKKLERSEDKLRVEKKGQKIQKKKFLSENQEGRQVESIISSKVKNIATETLQEKISNGNGKLMKFTDNIPKGDSPNSRNQDGAPTTDTVKTTAANQEKSNEEEKSQSLSLTEPQFDKEKESCDTLLTQEKPDPVLVTQKNDVSSKAHKSENRPNKNVMMTRKNATGNHLKKSPKQSANMLHDLQQQMDNKNCTSMKIKQESEIKVEEAELGNIIRNASETSTEKLKQSDKLQDETDQVIALRSCAEDECQTQFIPSSPPLNKIHDDISKSEVEDQPYASKDVQEFKQCDEIRGAREEITVLHNLTQHEYKRFPTLDRQEQLTEQEKDLKEIVIKSQLFLNTAEALFKLNIPISFLHTSDHKDEVANKKLVLNCGYELMKRKAKRNEVTLHPYMKTTLSCTKIRSLDDLVKQLCKDFEILNSYGGNVSDECDIAERLHEMLDKDIDNKDPDVNSIWDFEWNKMMTVFPEKDDIIKDVEKYVLNQLLDEITNDLILVNVCG